MKNLKIIFFVILLILLANIGKAQTFIEEWNNITNIPWLGPWHLSNNDVHIKGNFAYGSNNKYLNVLNINSANGWAMINRYTSNNGYFSNFWNNSGNNYIGDWYINSDDKYVTIFQSSTELHNLMAINSRTGHAQIMSINGNYWSQVWGNQGNGWISGWKISDDDIYLTGNFDYSTTTQELMCINKRSGWLAIFKISGNIINCIYSNSGAGNFSGWIMRTNDIYLSGNLDGGNETVLIAINPASKCSSVFKMINNYLTCIWYNNCNPAIGLGGWTNFYGTKFIIHDFDRNQDGKEEIMFVNSGNSWCTIKKFDATNQYWPDYFCNYGNGWIDGWHISPDDEYIGGNYSYADYRANMLFINTYSGFASLCYSSNNNNNQTNDNLSYEADENISISPNPFNMQTKLSVLIKKSENVKIIIYDILGKEIKLINNSILAKGLHSFVWDGKDNNNNILSSGNYFVKVISESTIETKRLVLNK